MKRIHQQTIEGKHFIHKYYLEKFGVFDIDFFTYKEAGYVKEWTFIFDDVVYNGITIPEFNKTLEFIKEKYDINTKSTGSKDVLIIFVNNLYKCIGFLSNYDENSISFEDYSMIYNDNFEFRNISHFYKNLNMNSMIEKGNELFDQLFIPNRKFFLTPTQYVLNKIDQNYNGILAKELFPKDKNKYNYLMSSFFGGLCICHYPTACIDDKLSEQWDRDSAYIYELICQKHLAEPLKEVNPKSFEYYIDFCEDYYAIFTIKITFSRICKGMDLYRDYFGNKLKEPNTTYTMVINNVDFINLKMLGNIESYDVIKLEIGKKDYLPKEIIDVLYDEYCKKVEYKKISSPNTKLQKIICNSVFGASVKKVRNFDKEKNEAILSPHWGILTASLARYHLLIVAKDIKGWLYSDTDSIYNIKLDYNTNVFENHNSTFRLATMEICNRNGYDYNKIKDLGCFQYKNTYKKFQANNKKQYMHTDINDVFEIVASGCSGENDETAYNFIIEDDETVSCIDMGIKIYPHVNEEKTSCKINGILFESNGSYWESKSSSFKKQLVQSYKESKIKERKKL